MAFTPNSDNSFKVAYIADAVTKGEFAYPPALIEDMYKARYRAFSQFFSDKMVIKDAKDITNEPMQNSTAEQNTTQLSSSDYTRLMNSPIGDMSKYTLLQLYYLRNGLFAQIGLDFSQTNPFLHNFYKKFNWYKPTIKSGTVAFKKLPEVAKKNVIKLLNEEKKRCGGSLVLADFYKVNARVLTKQKLSKYSKKDLRILRNSLIARYGYVFKDENLNRIFKNMPWYKPNPNITTSEIIDKLMNETQRANIQTILSVEHSK